MDFIIHLYCNSYYRGKYQKFLNTPPVKEGLCFGLCIIWLTHCLEARVNDECFKKYLKLNVGDDFFWSSFSMQRFNQTMLHYREVKADFLRRMDDRNIIRHKKASRENGLRYEIAFAMYEGSRYKNALNAFFDDKIKASSFGMVVVLKNIVNSSLHGIAILQIGNKKYLFEPSFGVFDATYCPGLEQAISTINLFNAGFGDFNTAKIHYIPEWSAEAICIMPKYII